MHKHMPVGCLRTIGVPNKAGAHFSIIEESEATYYEHSTWHDGIG